MNNERIKLPYEVGLKPLADLSVGYQVLAYSESGSWWGNGWIPFNNSWGSPYTIKGFAINKARNIMRWRGRANNNMNTCVVELQSGEIVWASWSKNNK